MVASPTRGSPPRVLLAALLLFALLPAGADVPVPQLTARVTDLTGTLTSGQQAALEQKLAGVEARHTAQVAVLLVPTTQPETVEQYAVRVFEKWKLGRKGVDNGVLLVVAKNDRKLRIEVGYGLEGAIPDALAKRIIDEEIVPRFKQADFYGGITAGADRILRLVEGEPMPLPQPRAKAPGIGFSTETLFIGFIVIMVLANVLHSLLGRGIGSGVVGVAAAIIVYVLAGFLVLAVIVGLVVFFIGLFGGSGPGRRGGWSSGSGWSSGGSWSSGGGGFSGGGGSSGGGGASGSW